ncbi:MAG: TetR/AcrR family transcriptional regulator [Gammaproteobacteria bacterium]|nr:TetR/AcrR family transcriptional regulator [Gammaproteobacteria bacterium]
MKRKKKETVAAIPSSKSGKRRKIILEAFHDCIIREGYSKTSLQDVAEAAEMTPSHLLYYFSGKSAMLEFYFESVSQRIMDRIDGFRHESPARQVELLADLYFAGKGITNAETGFMLECFGVAVHSDSLHGEKAKLDKFGKAHLEELFIATGCSRAAATDRAEEAYALLVGLRTSAFFDNRVSLRRARNLFRATVLGFADFGETN